MCTRAHGRQTILLVSSDRVYPCWEPQFPQRPRLACQWAPRVFLPYFPSTGVTGVLPSSVIFHGFWGLNVSPHDSKAKDLKDLAVSPVSRKWCQPEFPCSPIFFKSQTIFKLHTCHLCLKFWEASALSCQATPFETSGSSYCQLKPLPHFNTKFLLTRVQSCRMNNHVVCRHEIL